MIKGLCPSPVSQYFARKPPQSLENLLQKMDEYIRADNGFGQRNEEAQSYGKTVRGFRGRFHSKHVQSVHNPKQNEDKSQA